MIQSSARPRAAVPALGEVLNLLQSRQMRCAAHVWPSQQAWPSLQTQPRLLCWIHWPWAMLPHDAARPLESDSPQAQPPGPPQQALHLVQHHQAMGTKPWYDCAQPDCRAEKPAYGRPVRCLTHHQPSLCLQGFAGQSPHLAGKLSWQLLQMALASELRQCHQAQAHPAWDRPLHEQPGARHLPQSWAEVPLQLMQQLLPELTEWLLYHHHLLPM